MKARGARSARPSEEAASRKAAARAARPRCCGSLSPCRRPCSESGRVHPAGGAGAMRSGKTCRSTTWSKALRGSRPARQSAAVRSSSSTSSASSPCCSVGSRRSARTGAAALWPLSRAGRVDWTRPWLAPYRRCRGEAAAQAREPGRRSPSRCSADQAAGRRPRFVPAATARRGRRPTRPSSSHTGTVPTRDNLRDLFNGLVWTAFPACQAPAQRTAGGRDRRAGIGAARGPAARCAHAVRRERRGARMRRRAVAGAGSRATGARCSSRGARCGLRRGCVVFGHALLEKLVRAAARRLTAHVLLPDGSRRAGAVDDARWRVALDAPDRLAPKPLRAAAGAGRARGGGRRQRSCPTSMPIRRSSGPVAPAGTVLCSWRGLNYPPGRHAGARATPSPELSPDRQPRREALRDPATA